MNKGDGNRSGKEWKIIAKCRGGGSVEEVEEVLRRWRECRGGGSVEEVEEVYRRWRKCRGGGGSVEEQEKV